MTKTLLTTAVLLLGLASFTAAHAEWETLDTSSAVYAGATTSDQSAVASSATTKQAAETNATSK